MDPASAQRRASAGSSLGLRKLAAAWVVATVAALLLWMAWRLVWAEPLEAQASSLRAELDRQLEHFAWQRWIRPALHGSQREGNAAEVARARLLRDHAIEALGPQIEASLERGVPTPSVRELARRHAPQLRQLRAAAHCGQAWLAEPNLARSGSAVPEELAHLRSVELLLVAALDGSADECLAVAADAVRLAQDLVPGGGLARLFFAASEVRHAVSVTVRCARRATEGGLEHARRVFDSLATNSPPIAASLQAESLLNAIAHSARYELRPRLPEFWKDPSVRARSDPRRLLEAWQFELSMAHAARDLRDASPAELLRQAAAWETDRRAASNSLIRKTPTATNAATGVRYAVETQARIALAASLLDRVTASRQTEGRRLALQSSPLRDPFTGSSLRHRDGIGPGEFVLYSVGPNKRDDRGRADDLAVRWAPGPDP